MRPIKLSFAAFGSYRKTTVLDFRALGEQSFFLIHGATGAGKTTLLDAICFVLYGDASGSMREAKMLRNQDAGMDETTWVEMEFELREKVYSIWRSPEQLQAKKRGEGMTVRQGDAVLYVWENGEKKLLAAKYSNVTQKVEELLGFKSSQFRQVVLLPQGEFLRLLLAKSNERQEIMEVLFNTEIYRSIEEGLKQKAKTIEKQHEELRTKQEMLLADSGANSAAGLQELLECQKKSFAGLQQAVKEKKILRDQAYREEQQAMQLENLFRNAEKAAQELHDCQAKLQDLQSYKERYEQAEKAAQLADLDQQTKRAAAEQKSRQQAFNQLCQQEKSLQQSLGTAKKRYDTAAAQEPQRREKELQLSRLQEYAAAASLLQKAETSQQQRRVQAEGIRQLQEKTEQAQKQLEERKASLLARQSNLLVLAGSEAGAKLRAEMAARELEAWRELANYEAVLEKAAAAEQKAKEALRLEESSLTEKRAAVHRLQYLSNQGRAALLARDLAEGTPCPVCGSLQHPQPAVSDMLVPDDAEVNRAQELFEQQEIKCRAAEKSWHEAEQQLSAARSRAEQCRKQFTGEHSDTAVLQQKLAAAQEEQKAASAARQELEKLEVLQEENAAALQQAVQQLQAVQAQRKQAEEELNREQGSLQEKRQLLPEAYQRPGEAVRAQQACAAELADMIKQVREDEQTYQLLQQQLAAAEAGRQAAAENLSDSQQNVQKLTAALRQRCEEAGFPTEESYQKALAGKWADPAYRQLVRERIRGFEDRYTAADTAAKKAQEALLHKTRPDMAVISAQKQQAEHLWTESYAEEQRLLEQLRRLGEKSEILQRLQRESVKIEQAYRTVGRLAEVANGKNPHGITFQRYVLRSLLQDVVDAANERLFVMSHSQYRLQPGERARRNMAGGLDLEVFDEYTGYARSVATLSGGESFLASLSLALGLADVVQSYAGGIRLDTIFIDEGFGTLDAETLDTAIDTLLELQKSGRLVGIISHVEELKEHIGACLEVAKTRDGSTARFVVR